MQVLFLVLAAFAYRGLLAFSSQAGLSRELEEWFFVPTETSPLVVVLLAAWLIYRRRERLEALRAAPADWMLGALFLSLGTGVFLWSSLSTAPDLLAISMLFEGLGVAAVLFGRAGVRAVLLPACLLVFALPMPAPLLADVVYRCQLWTADYAGWLLFVIGQSAYVSGDQILLAEDHFAVIEGCSGLRSVQTLTMVAVLLVDLFGRRGWHALLIVGLAPLVAFALNGFRVLALILNPHSELVAVHNLQGVAILLGGLVLLYLIDGVLERYSEPGGVQSPEPAAASVGPTRQRPLVAGVALALLAVLSVAVSPWPPPAAAEPVHDQDLPLTLGEWRGRSVDGGLDADFLGTIGYRSAFRRAYVDPDGATVALLVLVGELEERYRSPISPKTVPPGSGWIVEETSQEAARSWHVMRSGTRRVVVEHWIEGSAGLADESLRALLALDATPWHREGDVLVLRLSTDVRGATLGAVNRARDRLRRFGAALEPDLAHLRGKITRKRID